MSSNKGYSWSAEHLLPVDFEEGQSGCESVDKQVGVVCRVVLLRVKVLTHATHAHTTKHIVSHIFRMTLLLEKKAISPRTFAFTLNRLDLQYRSSQSHPLLRSE